MYNKRIGKLAIVVYQSLTLAIDVYTYVFFVVKFCRRFLVTVFSELYFLFLIIMPY
jgi:hypothetical protein